VKPITASGRVVDLEGHGVERASVELVFAPSLVRSTETRADGSYEFPEVPLWADLKPDDPYAVLTRVESATLRAKWPGGGEAEIAVALSPDAQDRLEFPVLMLIPPGTLTVILTDAGNRPVMGVPVEVIPMEVAQPELDRALRGGMSSMSHEGAEMKFGPETLPKVDAAVAELLKKGMGIVQAYTDADGTARFGPFKASVVLIHGPFPTRGVRIDPRLPGTLRLTIARTCVECLVVDVQGNPLPGLDISLRPHRSWPKSEQDAFYNRNLADQSTRTDKAGIFRYEGLPDGKRFQLDIRDASGKGGYLVVADFDPSAPPAKILFTPARIQVRLEGTPPPAGQTIRAHALGVQEGGKREILYFSPPMTRTVVDMTGQSKSTWDGALVLASSFCNPPYQSLKLWLYAAGCQPVEGQELGPMAAGEQRDLTLQLLPNAGENPPADAELKRSAKEVLDVLLPRLLANDWSTLQDGALDEAFLNQVWPQGE
jgi:hypothetical protein